MKDELNLRAILTAFAEKAGTNLRGAIRDCVTDCMHLASTEGLDFDPILLGAEEVYQEEGGVLPEKAIQHSFTAEGQHRISVDSPRLDSDCLMLVFTDEGVVTDAVTGGVVVGTSSQMYDEIENGLS